MKKMLIGSFLCFILAQCQNKVTDPPLAHGPTSVENWTLLPFEKVDSANPVLLPDSTLEFTCPIRQESVKWAQKDVFNPAAVVRNDSIFMIFRAEDVIGKYAGTSRLGLAVSTDGLNFTKIRQPIFYPDHDAMKLYEWEGGV